MIHFDFSGRTVFVAGGTSGINLGIAFAFAQAGARLAVLSRSQAKVDAATKALSVGGQQALGFAADVRNPEAIADALKATHETFGPIDILVSGAAGNFPAAALDMSPNGFKAVIDIDLLGTFNVLREAHAYLRKPGASIVNISAPQAVIATPTQSHVGAAKAGVDMLTRVLALEWASDGIRVNSVMPGPIAETEGMARLSPTPQAREQVARSVPLGRYGTKQDVADLVMFLCSERASYITGAVVPVDGGWSVSGAGIIAAAAQLKA